MEQDQTTQFGQPSAGIDQAYRGPVLLTRPVVLGGLALAVLLAVAAYLIASRRLLAIGFPLDDAWIHQTYARNLAQYGQWAFVPGQPSAGSTAPLWSLLLSLGYILRLPVFGWTFFLGGASLLGLAVFGEALFGAYLPGLRRVVPFAGLFLIGEWHMAWAAVSGMETLMAGMVILLVLWMTTYARGRAWLWVGLLIGLSVWVRPDGITLVGPASLTLLMVEHEWRGRVRALGWLVAGVLLLFAPYLAFNMVIQGSIWPNTFYAKQAEYAALQQVSLISRFFNELKLPLIGSGLFLLPGFFAFAWRCWRSRNWAGISAILWFLGYALIYALRLPVTYQYGRYFMPAMPVYFVAGLAGIGLLLPVLRAGRVRWLLGRVWVISLGAIWLAFFVIGANRYAQDVAIIQTEMVDAAKWVSAHTAPGSLIAAHDIGAMGYFGGQHRILDLAGLVSPEVVPFIRDERRIAGWLDAQGADYLVVFGDWYSHLADGKQVVYRTTGIYSQATGGANTLVYRWKP